MSATKANSAPPDLYDRLRNALLWLPFDAYVRLIGLLLSRLGYESVTPSARTNWKGHNHAGGIDLFATLPGGLTPRRVVVQVKQFDAASKVFQRHIDELCGVAIRSRASEALLLTSGPASPSIHFDKLLSPLLPVRLIAGDQLLALLVECGVGVTPEGDLDDALLSRLTRESRGNRRGDSSASREVVVTVEVLSRSGRGAATLQRARLLAPS